MPIGRGRKLLLAEDHEINREVLTLQLAKLGFACDCAEDGEQAWDMLMSSNAGYAMLLTDCHMPRLDGYDLTKRLRAHEARLGAPRLPIVALTANALQGEAERCLALGMDAYLTKPLQLHELRHALVEILERQSPGAAATASSPPAAGSSEPTDAVYPALMQLCGGSLDKVAKLVRIFVAATEEDLKAMDQAAADKDLPRLRQLAHRLSSACHQLDEAKAVSALRAVERQAEADGPDPEKAVLALYGPTREALVSVLARASAFVRTHGPGA